MSKHENTRAEAVGGEQRGQEDHPSRAARRVYRNAASKEINVLHGAREWVKLNPKIWQKWTGAALDAARHERRVSIGLLMEQTRSCDHVNGNGDLTLINNDYSPIFARLMVEEHPELKPFIELRKSRFDKYFSAPVVVAEL